MSKNALTLPFVFISMPIGVKKGNINGEIVSIDFDVVLNNLILKSIPSSFNAFRIDDIKHSGLISDDVTIYLRESEICIFDLTFSNPNVFWELGYRFSTKPIETIILIAQKNSILPFNIRNYRIIFYDHFKPSTWEQFNKNLKEFIEDINIKKYIKPILSYEKDRILEQIKRSENASQLLGIWFGIKDYTKQNVDVLLELGKCLFNFGKTHVAVDILYKAYSINSAELEVVRTYGWYLRKNGDFELAERILLRALDLNKNDIDTLGMLGGLYKRLRQFDKAYNFYKKAYDLSPDVNYILLNLGLLYELAKKTTKIENPYYEKILNVSFDSKINNKELIWKYLAKGEAYIALGKLSDSIEEYRKAFELNASIESITSSTNNIEFLIPTKTTGTFARKLLTTILYPKIGKTLRDLYKNIEIKDVIEQPPILLHLSDLHFGSFFNENKKENRSSHRFDEGYSRKKLSSYISKQIDDLKIERGSSEGIYLVISGDIVNQGKDSEFEDARIFIEEVVEETELSRNKIIIVPGNHDINWKISEENKNWRFDNYLKFLSNIYNKELKNFYPFIDWDFKIDTERPKPEELTSIFHFNESNLLIIGLNSCTLEDEKHHFGALSLEQLERVEDYIKEIDEKTLKIAILHHHVFPMEHKLELKDGEIFTDDSIVRDFSVVEEYLLRLGIDVVLHGHKHNPAIRETTLYTESNHNKSLIICGSGSAGAVDVLLPRPIGNHFQIIRFLSYSRKSKEDFVDIEWKELKYKDLSKWKTSKRLIIKG